MATPLACALVTLCFASAVACGATSTSAPSGGVAAAPGPIVSELYLAGPTAYEGEVFAGRGIRILGNAHAPLRELVPELRAPEANDVFAVMGRDRDAIERWYLDHGYVEARVAPQTTIGVEGSDVVVTFRVLEEGPQYTLRSLEAYELIGGQRTLPLGWNPTAITGGVYRHADIVETVDAIARAYHDHGYAWADVTASFAFDRTAHTVGVVVPVERGGLTYFGSVSFHGNVNIPDEVLRGRLSIAEGGLFGETALRRSKQSLLDTGWFERVVVSVSRGATPEQVDVEVEVEERRLPGILAALPSGG